MPPLFRSPLVDAASRVKGPWGLAAFVFAVTVELWLDWRQKVRAGRHPAAQEASKPLGVGARGDLPAAQGRSVSRRADTDPQHGGHV